jgi:hypothetical protein
MRCQRSGCRATAHYTVYFIVTQPAAHPNLPDPGVYEQGDYCEHHAVMATIDRSHYMRPLPAFADALLHP